MFSRQLTRNAGGIARATLKKQSPFAAPVLSVYSRSFSLGGKPEAWVPSSSDELQRMTIQSLVHEISLQQLQSVQTVVPWFLKAMPAAYFRQVPEATQRSHLKAVASIYDLNQNDLSLRIEQKDANGHTDVTMIDTKTRPGQLLIQVHPQFLFYDSFFSDDLFHS